MQKAKRCLLRRLREADASARLSSAVMGLGCLRHGQVAKGLLYLAAEGLFIAYMACFGGRYLAKFGTLGDTAQARVWSEELQIYQRIPGDNSMLILLYSVLSIALCVLFVIIWRMNLLSACRACERTRAGERQPSLRAEARALLEKAYPGQTAEAEFLFLPRHPQGPPLDVNAVLDAWRERSGEKLLLVTTARADATAHACAAKLARPAVRLIDGERLCALLTAFPPPKREAAKPRRRFAIAASRERAPRRLLFGLLLLATYLLLGNPLYLGAALVTLLLAALGWKKPPVPRRLFK